MPRSRIRHTAKRYALIALGVLLLEEIVGSALFILDAQSPHFKWHPWGPLAAAFTHWVLPFLAVYLLEKRDWRSLGLAVSRSRLALYALYGVVGLVLPGIVAGFSRGLLIEFVEQVAYIGVAEELFFRGYLTTRLFDWLGHRKGIAVSAFIFGLVHVLSRVSQHGFQYPQRLAEVFVQTLLGGLLFAIIYWRARNIVPGAILHTSMNMYLPSIMELLAS
jgi:membrane protease YdiL (CAAX protease family)